eukprot:gnl/MRDRNA2_/MRDRNA2_84325_c0_seq1.p1 gnl/MRDRNA2_/MRDRNA2_84325_c0~~gnl/MRDRNA2_/MRDRNA2_84325_c0_seq1.p1  ORF type:complete len:256 (+),score=24.45 gnl/MRDRNA2_/MRDRNA2_84325_c0_seq1:730-1497(+)
MSSPKARPVTPYARSPDSTPTPPLPVEPPGPPLRLAASATLANTASQIASRSSDLEFLNQDVSWSSSLPQSPSRVNWRGMGVFTPGTVEAISHHRKLRAEAVTAGQNLTPAPKGVVPEPPKDVTMTHRTCRPFGGSSLRPSRHATVTALEEPTRECFAEVASCFLPDRHQASKPSLVTTFARQASKAARQAARQASTGISSTPAAETPRKQRYAAAWRTKLVSVEDGGSLSKGRPLLSSFKAVGSIQKTFGFKAI